MWNLKRTDTTELAKQKETQRLRKQTYSFQGEGIIRDFGKVMIIQPYSKWITNKGLWYSRWNSAQCYVPAWMGGGSRGERIHVYVWLSPFAAPLKLNHNISNQLHPSTK